MENVTQNGLMQVGTPAQHFAGGERQEEQPPAESH